MRGGGGGKFCRGGINCRGHPAGSRYSEPSFHWVFHNGTRFADLCFQGEAALCGNSRSSAMLFALGAASAALDTIKSLTSSTSSSAQSSGFSQASADLFGLSSGASAPGSTGAVPGFSGGGQISPTTLSALLDAQSQSSTGAATSASGSTLQNLFSPIDANGDGTSSTSGASTTSATNSDGSTTTSLTYANGSKVTTTSPAPTTSSSAVSSSYNLIDQLIQRETNAISFSAPALSVNV